MIEQRLSRRSVYDNLNEDELGEHPGIDFIPGGIIIREKQAKTPEDLEHLVHQGEVGLKVQKLLDAGLSVGAKLKGSGEISIFVGKHKGLIGGTAAIAAGITTAAGVLILHNRSRK